MSLSILEPDCIIILTGDHSPREYRKLLHQSLTQTLKVIFREKEPDLYEQDVQAIYYQLDLLQRLRIQD